MRLANQQKQVAGMNRQDVGNSSMLRFLLWMKSKCPFYYSMLQHSTSSEARGSEQGRVLVGLIWVNCQLRMKLQLAQNTNARGNSPNHIWPFGNSGKAASGTREPKRGTGRCERAGHAQTRLLTNSRGERTGSWKVSICSILLLVHQSSEDFKVS